MRDLKDSGQNLLVTNCNTEKFQQYDGEDKVLTSYELRDKLMADKREPHVHVMSKLPGLDYACEGFQDGELVIISGPTKQGKTLLAQTLTVNFANQKQYPCWFTYEVPARQFLDQFPILPLFYLPSKNQAQDFDWFMNKCMEAFFKYNTRIFFIDHLHFLVDMARVSNTSSSTIGGSRNSYSAATSTGRSGYTRLSSDANNSSTRSSSSTLVNRTSTGRAVSS